VSHGNHGWILTGFTATADPLATASFRITSVRVTGPLYGLQSRDGYDMPPDTKLTPTQLRRYFTPWRYTPMRMVWDGRYVSIQPVPVIVAVVPAPRAPAASSPSATVRSATASSTQAALAGAAAASTPGSGGSAGGGARPDNQPAAVGFETLATIVIGLGAMIAVGLALVRRRQPGAVDHRGLRVSR
jgi:hypothetical protein